MQINLIDHNMERNHVQSKQFAALVILITIIHAVSFIRFGATYWYDSIVYFDLSDSIFGSRTLSEFYTGPVYYGFQHIQIGTSFIYGLAHALFGTSAWQVYALLQHAAAAFSLLYFLSALRKHLNSSVLWPIAIILSLHPFYQSFHNAVMTESLSSSMLLLMAGSLLNLATEDQLDRRHFAILIISGMIGIQFRAQLSLFVIILLLGIMVFRKYLDWLKFTVVSISIFLSIMLFPVGRWAATGKFFLPNIDNLMVTFALWSNTSQSKDVEAILAAQDFPLGINARDAAHNGLTYEQSLSWVAHLAEKGYSDSDIRKIVKNVAWKIRFDNWQNISSQLDAAIASAGLLNVSLFHTKEEILSQGLTAEKFRTHNKQHFGWLSWTSNEDYEATLNRFLAAYEQSMLFHPEAVDRMKEAIFPNLVSNKSYRDLLGLNKLGTDVWVYGWMMGMLTLLLMKKKELLLILGSPPIVNYCINLMIGFGNIRYSYVIFPFYIVSTFIFIVYMLTYVRNKFNDSPVRPDIHKSS